MDVGQCFTEQLERTTRRDLMVDTSGLPIAKVISVSAPVKSITLTPSATVTSVQVTNVLPPPPDSGPPVIRDSLGYGAPIPLTTSRKYVGR